MPARIFIRVDFPAPFSPTTASASPAASERETASRACTPGKRLLIWRTSRRGAITLCIIKPVGEQREPTGLWRLFLSEEPAQFLVKRLDIVAREDAVGNVHDAVL